MSGHGHAHGHAHAHSAAEAQRGRLVTVLAISVTIVLAEVLGAALSGSLVLLSDAGHMLADSAGLGLSLLAVTLGARPATPARTFGYQRSEILAALANAVVLLGVSGFVIVQALRRLDSPPPVDTGLMVAFGALAVVGNGVALLLLRAGARESLNVRGAFLEVAADLLGALAVIVAALLIRFAGMPRADALASLVIGLLILPRTWRLLREAADVLLEATPRGVDLAEVRAHILQAPGVVDVHDLHAWTITSGVPVLSAHVVVSDACLTEGRTPQTLDRLQHCLAGHFDVEHSTFQLEPATHAAHEHATHA